MSHEINNLAVLAKIDIFKEIGSQQQLVSIGELLQSGKVQLSPLLEGIRGNFSDVHDLRQYSSADDMTSRYTVSRQRRVTDFDNLRNEYPDLKLHAQCGQVFDKDIHILDVLSFATPTCVRNCLREPCNDVGDMVDPTNDCVDYKKCHSFCSLLQDGGTECSPNDARLLYDENVTQSDFYTFTSSGNDYETLQKDIRRLHKVAGGGLTFNQFELALRLDSVCDIAKRIAMHYAHNGTALHVVHWSSRNHLKAFECEQAMFMSENGLVQHYWLTHPMHAQKGFLKRLDPSELHRLARELASFGALFNGMELRNGQIAHAQEESAAWYLRKGGLLGGPNAAERERDIKLRKQMSADQSDGTALYNRLRATTDLDPKELLDMVEEEFDYRTRKFVKGVMDAATLKRDATARFHKLKDETQLDTEAILSMMKKERVYKENEGVLDYVRSYANMKKKADERAVNKYNMIPARSDQIISVFCPDSNCKNTGFTKYIYNHSDGKTKIVRPLCGKRPTGKRECQKTMDPVETQTPLETISERAVQKIENVCLLPLFVLPFTQNIHSHYIIITYPLKMILRKRLLLPMYHLSTR